MAAWQKWWVTLLFLIPALIAGSGILLWYFQSEAAAQLAINWLATPRGQLTLVVFAIYLIILAVGTIATAIFRPTTVKQLTIVRDGAYQVNIDRGAVEKSLRLSLAPYDLYNAAARVKMHRRHRQADVTITAMLSQRSDARHLRASLHHTIANNLKQQFNIDLRKLWVKLTPYDHQQKVAIV